MSCFHLFQIRQDTFFFSTMYSLLIHSRWFMDLFSVYGPVCVYEREGRFFPSTLSENMFTPVCVCVYQPHIPPHVSEQFISVESEMALNSLEPLTPGNIPVPASLKCAGAPFQKTTDLLSLLLPYLPHFLPPSFLRLQLYTKTEPQHY